MDARRDQQNFQLIVITHDERYAVHLWSIHDICVHIDAFESHKLQAQAQPDRHKTRRWVRICDTYRACFHSEAWKLCSDDAESPAHRHFP